MLKCAGYVTEKDDQAGGIQPAGTFEPARIALCRRHFSSHIKQEREPDCAARQPFTGIHGAHSIAVAPHRVKAHLPAAPVRVNSWDIEDQQDDWLRAVITCGSGTYIRALARDLGRGTGSAAHLASLRRTRCGAFDVADAASLEDLRNSPPPLLSLTVVVANA